MRRGPLVKGKAVGEKGGRGPPRSRAGLRTVHRVAYALYGCIVCCTVVPLCTWVVIMFFVPLSVFDFVISML